MPERGVHELDDTPTWVTRLEWQTLERETPGGFVVYEVQVRIRREGLLAVVKAEKNRKGIVAFKGARTVKSLSGRVSALIGAETTRWKEDEYY